MRACAQQTDSQGNPVSMTVPHVQLINPENQIVEVSSSGLATAVLPQAGPDPSYWRHVLIVLLMFLFCPVFIDCKSNGVCVCFSRMAAWH